jgi:chemotaxis protein CheZ
MGPAETGAASQAEALSPAASEELLTRIGMMTRALHDNLRGLGLDKLLAKAASDIPDARDRLDYVARMSEQAAQKVLNATEEAGPMQERIHSGAQQLAGAWQGLLDGDAGETQWRALAQQTVQAMQTSVSDSGATKALLMDIMMAQDFQDLTGQVIKKVTTIVHNLEQQLVQMLIDFSPADMKIEAENSLLNGPQINADAPDIVADQEQVDDLLGSLGF